MPVKNYGPRGCLLVLVLAGGIIGALILFVRTIHTGGPDFEQIGAIVGPLVSQAPLDTSITKVKVTSIHPRRARYTWSVDRWAVKGEADIGGATEDYIAVVRAVCDNYAARTCWVLEQLSIAGQIYKNEFGR
ncbi:MAG: hypothetical protein QF926_10140 [Alphaproteobacteria bacterium]|jgi:hypothetical protein|nr:hypothetical protein [Alphaproteobacteria bacterium]MDP6516965.1 hypothetical protein [Alphaproteobacteria bacterium]|tara:strand:- start:479 stop:874 length:396 start_codon:yes stop_codon:yes gene_type:complete